MPYLVKNFAMTTSVEAGKNPDGTMFFTIRVGAGLGGGYWVDPKGKAKGWSEKLVHPVAGGGLSIGGFAQGGAQVLMLSILEDISAGVTSETPSLTYTEGIPKDWTPSYSLDPKKGGSGLRLIGAIGVEFSFFQREQD